MRKTIGWSGIRRCVAVPLLSDERLKGAEGTSERSETGCYCKSNKSYGIYHDNYIKPKEAVKHLTLVKRIQNRCMDIYEYLLDANRLKLDTSKSERQELQTKAISCCDKLSCYVELSMKLNLIGSDTVGYVKYMSIAWRSKDKER